jgi:hypothetical protein
MRRFRNDVLSHALGIVLGSVVLAVLLHAVPMLAPLVM